MSDIPPTASNSHNTSIQGDGFVFGVSLDGSGGATPISNEADAGQASWIHLDYSAGDAEAWLIRHGLDPNVAESLVRSETRPRTLTTAGGSLVVLRGVNGNPGANPEDMVSLRMWIEPNRLITVRQRRLMSIQDVRGFLEQGQGPTDIPDLVGTIVERIADRISEFVESIAERMEGFEEVVDTADPVALRRDTASLRRQSAIVRRFLAPQREALDNLHRSSRGLLGEVQAYGIREQSDRITRYVEDLDLVRERALVVQEELMNRISQQQNERMYVLSVVAAVFLPVTFITGLFGMNVDGMPGVETPAAFWIVCAAMLGLGLGVLALFRLKNWF